MRPFFFFKTKLTRLNIWPSFKFMKPFFFFKMQWICRPLQKLHKIKNSEHLNIKLNCKRYLSYNFQIFFRMLSTRESGCASGTDLNSDSFHTIWTCFFTVLEHTENFNMLFYSFQHSFSICSNALQISTCSEIFTHFHENFSLKS